MKVEKNIKKEKIIKYQIKLNDDVNRRALTSQRDLRRTEDSIHIKYHFPKANTILCIGARDDSEVLSFIKQGFLAEGIDVSNETQLITRKDISELDNNIQYDIVYCSHVLEHISDPSVALHQIRKISRMGVFIILPIDNGNPNIEHPTIYDIMKYKPEKHFNQTISAWNDFDLLQPYEMVYNCYRRGLTEDYEIAALFKLE